MDLLCFCSVLCLLCLSVRLFICALWSPAGKGLTFVVSICEFVTFPLVSCVWVWYLIVSIPDLCTLTYFHLDGDNPRSTSYGVYISQLIPFARASSCVTDFNTRNKLLTQKLLKQDYWYHKLCKIFSKFYRRYYDLIPKFKVGLENLLRQGLSKPEFYGD